MTLKFRNLDVSPDDPVEYWGFEGLLAAVDRGAVPEWRRIERAIRNRPRGKVAGELREVIAAAEDVAVASVLERILDDALAEEDVRDRESAAEAMLTAFRESGLSRAVFAERLGTSPSRLSTYLSGNVTPSAALLIRAQRIGSSSAENVGAGSECSNMTRYAVFLRGINVGGINIKMADLRTALASLPLRNVSTLLATGNIVCSADAAADEVKDMVEQCLRENFNYEAWVVVLTSERVSELAAACPYPADSAEMHAYITLSSDPETLDELYEAAGGEANTDQHRLGPEATAWRVKVGETLESEISKLTAKTRYKRATTTRNLRTLLKVRDAAAPD